MLNCSYSSRVETSLRWEGFGFRTRPMSWTKTQFKVNFSAFMCPFQRGINADNLAQSNPRVDSSSLNSALIARLSAIRPVHKIDQGTLLSACGWLPNMSSTQDAAGKKDMCHTYGVGLGLANPTGPLDSSTFPVTPAIGQGQTSPFISMATLPTISAAFSSATSPMGRRAECRGLGGEGRACPTRVSRLGGHAFDSLTCLNDHKL